MAEDFLDDPEKLHIEEDMDDDDLLEEEVVVAPKTYVNPIIALEAENAELKEQALRLMADMENLRRRTEKEVRDSRTFAIANFARDLLQINDNLGRGLDAVAGEVMKDAEGPFKNLIDGVQLTERELLKVLEKHGVRKLSPEGEKFDPHFHQAMFEIPNKEVANNTVMQVIQDGYALGSRLLRPAMVGIAKGGPKFVQEAPAETPAEEDPETKTDAVDKSV